MKSKALLALILTAAFATAPLHAQSPMVETMEAVDDAYRGFRRAAGNDGVELARAGQKATLEALALMPEMIEKMPEDAAKARSKADYRRLLGLVYLKFVEAEIAYLDGDTEAVERIRDELKEIRKEGHDKYIEE